MTSLGAQLMELEKLVDGLYVMSETDAPLIPFVWPAPLTFSPAALVAAAAVAPEVAPSETAATAESAPGALQVSSTSTESTAQFEGAPPAEQTPDETVDVPIEMLSLDEFFEPMVTEADWHGEAEQAAVQRFKELKAWLVDNLQQPQVYRIGEIQINTYLVGQLHERVVGLSTVQVET